MALQSNEERMILVIGGQRTTEKGKNERDIAKITMELKPSFPPYPTVMLSQCLSVESKMIKLLGHNKAVT